MPVTNERQKSIVNHRQQFHRWPTGWPTVSQKLISAVSLPTASCCILTSSPFFKVSLSSSYPEEERLCFPLVQNDTTPIRFGWTTEAAQQSRFVRLLGRSRNKPWKRTAELSRLSLAQTSRGGAAIVTGITVPLLRFCAHRDGEK